MKVVVFGATGNVGTSVVEALAHEPEVTEIVGVARRTPSSWQPPKTRFEAADVRSPQVADHLRGTDVVVLLTWAFQPTHRPLTTWDVNVLGSMDVLQAAADAGVGAVVYASSLAAYSPGPGRHVDESWPTHSMPTAAYGREKAYLERYLDAYELRHPGIRVVRMRTCFVFKRSSASEQRRIFAGPLLPRAMFRPGRLPVVPLPAGLRFQAMHGDDAGEAYRLAVLSDARGAYNVAADPIIDGPALGALLESRAVQVPKPAVAAAMAAAWRLRLIPADESLVKLFLSLPTLDASRIRAELGWQPRRSGLDALREVVQAMADGAGGPTPPLHSATSTGRRPRHAPE
ncbi:MAG: NAD-dependent epimerase/dehydratase family protein [Jiangellaceae bacterium]|nr:NAD-dependent epimerase/dehydratase family protein [Jiangellaceae bacterium]